MLRETNVRVICVDLAKAGKIGGNRKPRDPDMIKLGGPPKGLRLARGMPPALSEEPHQESAHVPQKPKQRADDEECAACRGTGVIVISNPADPETRHPPVCWVREDLVGLAANLESVLIGIETYDSFECRGQNRIVGTKLSEHGRANALDIRAIWLKSGRGVQLTNPVSKDIRIAVRTSVCERFTTVLGPGADGYHEDHIHIDLADRRGGYWICQWQRRKAAGPRPLIGGRAACVLSACAFTV
jgi:hypothetical protein